MEWTDSTMYSRGERGVKEPTTFDVSSGFIRIVVTCAHIDYRGRWIMRCPAVGIDRKPLTALTLEDAKGQALRIVKDRIGAMLKDLGNITK